MPIPTDSIKISQLPQLTVPTANDEIPTVSSGVTQKINPALLSTDWKELPIPPSSITHLGNGSYQLICPAVNYSTFLSAGMRIRTARTVLAPTQSTLLNGTSQYYSKASPAAMTFTDDFTVSARVKLTKNGQISSIITRYNGTSGWQFQVETTGVVTLMGRNGASANFSYVQSYQSLPLNKWVNVVAQLDMSAFSATPATSYIMFDGVDVPANVVRGGTNPTALVQAGNLEIGSANGGTSLFPGVIAQVAVFNSKVTQATMRSYMSQSYIGNETNLISAYSFNNTLNDLNTVNANTLTANGGAAATNADSPFGGQASGAISPTLDYGIVSKVIFSTDTTITLQVPEGCTIPTTGGVSAISYSSNKMPYGFPGQKGKWTIQTLKQARETAGFGGITIWSSTNHKLTIPIGEWELGWQSTNDFISSVSGNRRGNVTVAEATPVNGTYNQPLTIYQENSSTTDGIASSGKKAAFSASAQTIVSQYFQLYSATGTEQYSILADLAPAVIYAENAYL